MSFHAAAGAMKTTARGMVVPLTFDDAGAFAKLHELADRPIEVRIYER